MDKPEPSYGLYVMSAGAALSRDYWGPVYLAVVSRYVGDRGPVIEVTRLTSTLLTLLSPGSLLKVGSI